MCNLATSGWRKRQGCHWCWHSHLHDAGETLLGTTCSECTVHDWQVEAHSTACYGPNSRMQTCKGEFEVAHLPVVCFKRSISRAPFRRDQLAVVCCTCGVAQRQPQGPKARSTHTRVHTCTVLRTSLKFGGPGSLVSSSFILSPIPSAKSIKHAVSHGVWAQARRPSGAALLVLCRGRGEGARPNRPADTSLSAYASAQ